MPVTAMLRRSIPILLLALVGAGCAGDSGGGGNGSGDDELIVQAANYELVAGEQSRFIAGILTTEQLFVSYGTVDVEFSYLGTGNEGEPTEAGPSATASFLAIEGEASASGPVATTASEGRGVYAAEVTFDRAGFWAARVTAELEEGSAEGEARFQVLEGNVYPAVGDPALPTRNHTLESVKEGDVPAEGLDSRARDGEPVPDHKLHTTTIARSIRQREPALVVFSTPVYCVSRFCGPVTDMVSELSDDYRDRANFIHIEVWREFQDTVVNKAAADWIYRQDDLTEPWIYLIDADGTIAARWDNVATRAEIEPLLEELPPLS